MYIISLSSMTKLLLTAKKQLKSIPISLKLIIGKDLLFTNRWIMKPQLKEQSKCLKKLANWIPQTQSWMNSLIKQEKNWRKTNLCQFLPRKHVFRPCLTGCSKAELSSPSSKCATMQPTIVVSTQNSTLRRAKQFFTCQKRRLLHWKWQWNLRSALWWQLGDSVRGSYHQNTPFWPRMWCRKDVKRSHPSINTLISCPRHSTTSRSSTLKRSGLGSKAARSKTRSQTKSETYSKTITRFATKCLSIANSLLKSTLRLEWWSLVASLVLMLREWKPMASSPTLTCSITSDRGRRAGHTRMTAEALSLRPWRISSAEIKSTTLTVRNATRGSSLIMGSLISTMMLMNIHSPYECPLMTSMPNKSARSSTQTSFKGTSVSRSTSRKPLWASLFPSCASLSSMKTSRFFTRLRASINSAGVHSLTIQTTTNPLRHSTPMTFQR